VTQELYIHKIAMFRRRTVLKWNLCKCMLAIRHGGGGGVGVYCVRGTEPLRIVVPRSTDSGDSGRYYEPTELRGCTQKYPDSVHNEIYAYNNKHSLRSNIKDYGGKTHWTDSQNSGTTASSVRELTIWSSRSRRPVRKLLDISTGKQLVRSKCYSWLPQLNLIFS
jgi:hypothetical protein